jgi:hypothetical protein
MAARKVTAAQATQPFNAFLDRLYRTNTVAMDEVRVGSV